MNVTKALTTDYENIRLPSRAKTNPIKPNQDYPIGTSRLEGVKNKIKVIKRKAYAIVEANSYDLFCLPEELRNSQESE